jgi:predicted DNA-binding helix-hairpin-helix protein
MDDGMLPRIDPKLAIARENKVRADVNSASYDELIRVPGIGPKTAKVIMDVRNNEKITKYSQLSFMQGLLEKAKPFLDVDGKRQTALSEF